MIQPIDFVSQRNKRWKDLSCVVASLKMILDYLGCKNNGIIYCALSLMLRVNIQKKQKGGIPGDKECGDYDEDICDYCKLINVKARIFDSGDYDELILKINKSPVLIKMKAPPYDHWCVAIGNTNGIIP